MNTVTFDTLKFVETLEQAGVERKHASAMASAVREAQDSALVDHTSALATKADVAVVRSDVTSVRSDVALLRKDMEAMELRLNARMDALQNKLLVKLALFMVGLVGLVGALLKFFPQA